jgi:hypothetical protein
VRRGPAIVVFDKNMVMAMGGKWCAGLYSYLQQKEYRERFVILDIID